MKSCNCPEAAYCDECAPGWAEKLHRLKRHPSGDLVARTAAAAYDRNEDWNDVSDAMRKYFAGLEIETVKALRHTASHADRRYGEVPPLAAAACDRVMRWCRAEADRLDRERQDDAEIEEAAKVAKATFCGPGIAGQRAWEAVARVMRDHFRTPRSDQKAERIGRAVSEWVLAHALQRNCVLTIGTSDAELGRFILGQVGA